MAEEEVLIQVIKEIRQTVTIYSSQKRMGIKSITRCIEWCAAVVCFTVWMVMLP